MSIYEQISGTGIASSGDYGEIHSLEFSFNEVNQTKSGTTKVVMPQVVVSGTTQIIMAQTFVVGATSISVSSSLISGAAQIIVDTTTASVVHSGTGTVSSVNQFANLSGTITVSPLSSVQPLSGTLSVTQPVYVSGTIKTTGPIDLSGTIVVIGVSDKYLSGTIETSYEYIKELPGTLRVSFENDLDGILVVSADGSKSLSGTITICEYAFLSGTLFVSPARFLSGTLTVPPVANLPGTIKVTQPELLNGSIVVIKASQDVSGTITTTTPTDISGSITTTEVFSNTISGTMDVVSDRTFANLSGTTTTTRPADLSGTISVIHVYQDSASLPGSVVVVTHLETLLSGTLTVYPHADLSGTITTVRPSKDLNGHIKIGNKEYNDLDAIMSVWSPLDLNGQLIVVRPNQEISGTLSIVPYSDLSGTLTIESPIAELSGTLEVGIFANFDISGTVTVDKWVVSLSGTIDVRGGASDLSGTMDVELFGNISDLPGAIMVIPGNKNRDIPGSIVIGPYQDLSGTLTTERPFLDLPGTLIVIPRFDNNVAIDQLFAQDSLSVVKVILTPISGTVNSDVISISQSDSFTWEWLPHMRATGTDTMSIGQNDSFDFFMYGEETTEWSYPIQLTDNIVSSNDYSLPTVTEYDGKVYVAYNQNFNNELQRTIVVKTQDGGTRTNSKWIVSNIYPDTIKGQFIGPDAQMILEQASGFVLHPGPQPNEANDYFESTIIFTPESYDIEASIYRDLWETLQYQMLREGSIVYPPKQWATNPLRESVNGPTDSFDPIPKHGDFTVGDKGYYQDFNNFFTGNG